jgi:hypothetical protein
MLSIHSTSSHEVTQAKCSMYMRVPVRRDSISGQTVRSEQ